MKKSTEAKSKTVIETLEEDIKRLKTAVGIYQEGAKQSAKSISQEFTPVFLAHAETVDMTIKHVAYQRNRFEECWNEYIRLRHELETKTELLANLKAEEKERKAAKK